MTDSLVFPRLISQKYSKWKDAALAAVAKMKNKAPDYLCNKRAQLARLVDTEVRALEFARLSLKSADSVGSWDEKPSKHNVDRYPCYLKVIKAYAALGRPDELMIHMRKSWYAKNIASFFEDSKVEIYQDLTKIFSPTGTSDEINRIFRVIPTYYSDGFLLIKIIKTYKENVGYHPMLLDELNALWEKRFHNQTWYINRTWQYIDLAPGLDLVKGYCYLGCMEKALEIIKSAESVKESQNSDWWYKAYMCVADAYAVRGDWESCLKICERIPLQKDSIQRKILAAKAFLATKDENNAMKSLLEAEAVKSTSSSVDSDSLLKMAELYFQMNRISFAVHSLVKAEKIGDPAKLAKRAKAFMLKMQADPAAQRN